MADAREKVSLAGIFDLVRRPLRRWSSSDRLAFAHQVFDPHAAQGGSPYLLSVGELGQLVAAT